MNKKLYKSYKTGDILVYTGDEWISEGVGDSKHSDSAHIFTLFKGDLLIVEKVLEIRTNMKETRISAFNPFIGYEVKCYSTRLRRYINLDSKKLRRNSKHFFKDR